MPGPLHARLTVVVAAAGYGKTTAVRQWVGDGVVVVDDAHKVQLCPEPQPSDRLVLITRRPLPVSTLLRYELGAPVEIGPRHLALPPQKVARILADQYGIDDPDKAAAVHRCTAGWPALTHLVAASGSPLDGSLATPGTPLFDYVAAEVLDDLPEVAVDLLGAIAELGTMSAPLAAAIGYEHATEPLTLLSRLGLLQPPVPGRAWYRPVPVVAEVARSRVAMSAAQRRVVVALAAEWHTELGRPADALRLALASADHLRCARLLNEHGNALLADGAAKDVVAAVKLLPAHLRGPAVELLHADALQATGDTEGAVAVYAALAGDADELPLGLAWRYGSAVYMWGDPHDALAVLRRGRMRGEGTADEALLLAWTAAAHWLAADLSACGDYAEKAYETACRAGDDRALAAAHIARALHADLGGDPVDLQSHYTTALRLADACGDTVQVLRIRVNLAAALEQQGCLAEALAMLSPAVARAEAGGFAATLALALANEGALLQALGRLDDAAASFRRAVRVYQDMHSRKVAYPLTGLGDVHRLRGQLAQAKASYGEALRAATEDGNNRQGLVPALVGLAQVVAQHDPVEARILVDRAMEHASGRWTTQVLVARAWVAWHAGRCADTHRDAQAAVESASVHRDRTGLADALEVLAAATRDPVSARKALTEALAIWTDCGAELGADRIRVALGRLLGSNSDQKLLGRLAESRLVAAGASTPPISPEPDEPGPVEIRVFGGFSVLVNGHQLPLSAWQSRKARELLRILVARRGRPSSRDELADLLWGPIEPAEQDKVAHRLSVALSTLRGVLDPHKLAPADHFVVASQANIALDLGRVTVDVEDLFAEARYGFRLRDRGETADAWAVLTAAERACTGEVFADDPYPDWAQPLREEAHATHLHVLRVLVELSQRAGDVDDVVRYLLGILAIDPYDEQAHRDLVTTLTEAGRHGEADRAHRRYVAAMSEIGVRVRGLIGR